MEKDKTIYYPPKEYAEKVGVHPATILRMKEDGRLKCIPLGKKKAYAVINCEENNKLFR